MIVANIFGLGNGPELAIVGVVVLVLFGTSKVGTFFKSLGEGVKEFKKASTDEPSSSVMPSAPTTTPPAASPAPSSNNLNAPEAPKPTDSVGDDDELKAASQASKD